MDKQGNGGSKQVLRTSFYGAKSRPLDNQVQFYLLITRPGWWGRDPRGGTGGRREEDGALHIIVSVEKINVGVVLLTVQD